ncbi:MerR family transcriptional regulator [Porphyromonas loveana]|uniref:DNA-binding transcriptional MerR regulator n=1 Tax=Porphyromonas loveana TaxID=1884669 RepID=A0A2U1FKZ8_9PORP|nr:MerR family transcriptional regulator [Porphyromonas loveana]PVZ12848.1 DNA-binding transcriptional MerR regulator [Porphyromonas loveana]
MKKQKPGKLYYSISEVARMFGVPDSTLRFWEKEFPALKPRTSPGGTRRYTAKDIETVRLIHHLTKEKGLTLSGAKQALSNDYDGTTRREEVINRLKEIRQELCDIRDAIDKWERKNLY